MLLSRMRVCSMAHAIYTVYKKPNLDSSAVNNYRQISLLPFLSKILEKTVCDQMLQNILRNTLLEIKQCAYKPGHSTETALLASQDYLWSAQEQGKVSALILTDLSAAFDTVDHSVLVRRLKRSFSISDMALAWIESYLLDRSFVVSYNSKVSTRRQITCGVPQGSVLGPLLFSCYVSPIQDVIKKLTGATHISYADDLQLIVSADSNPPHVVSN